MACCFRSSSRHDVRNGVSELKIISLNTVMVSLMASSSSYFVFIRFRQGILTYLQVLTETSCSFIISFVTPGRLQKSFRPSFFTPQKLHHHRYHHHHHLACCIAGFLIDVFTFFNIYLRMIIFTLFVDRINL